MLQRRVINILLLSGLLVWGMSLVSEACTRVLFTNPDRAVLVGNNMDWIEEMHTSLLVFPRGYSRTSRITSNPLSWSSKYGSIAAAPFGDMAAATGMNEKGLAVHLLGLNASDFGNRNEELPGLSIDLWAQYYLDNFESVDEAIQYTQNHPFQVVTFMHPKAGKINLHLAMEDASGDSAIFEYIHGKLEVYHSREYRILTNDPVFTEQQENLKQYSGLGGEKPLPGTTFPIDRFVRASYYLQYMSTPKTDKEAIFKLLSILKNAAQPYGTNTPERTQNGVIFESIWRTVSDLTHRHLYFDSSMRFNIFKVDLNAFNLEAGSPVMRLDLQNEEDYSGEVSGKFLPLG